jgi:hypothetical protein
MDPARINLDSYEDEPTHLYQYGVSSRSMRERLDSLGFNINRARADYVSNHGKELAEIREFAQLKYGTKIPAELCADELLPARELGEEIKKIELRTYKYWHNVLSRLLPQGFQIYHDAQNYNYDDQEMYEDQRD